MRSNPDGWWQMWCWNSLSWSQQRRLVEIGNLPIDAVPEATTVCNRPADLCIETRWDEMDGPRFYCLRCGSLYLHQRLREELDRIHAEIAVLRRAIGR